MPAGAIDETETYSVILFSDAKTAKDQIFTVTRTFAENTLLRKDLKTDMTDMKVATNTDWYLNYKPLE